METKPDVKCDIHGQGVIRWRPRWTKAHQLPLPNNEPHGRSIFSVLFQVILRTKKKKNTSGAFGVLPLFNQLHCVSANPRLRQLSGLVRRDTILFAHNRAPLPIPTFFSLSASHNLLNRGHRHLRLSWCERLSPLHLLLRLRPCQETSSSRVEPFPPEVFQQ